MLLEQVYSSSSFESKTWDLKVVLNFFLGGKVTCLGLNLAHGVGGFVCISSL
jgi:hypothetical protein